jgi:single-strand DNA-binding protein
MYALNRVTLVGRVGQDPEIRHLENSVAVGRFSLAVTERYKDKDGSWADAPTEWHDIVVWRNLAERAKAELKKGKLIYVEGKLSARKWEDKDGNARKTVEILARDFRAFETYNTGGGGGGGNFPSMADDPFANRPSQQANANANANANAKTNTPPAANPSHFDDAPDDDLPF